LSRRIVFYVFISVIAIETIILIPSYMKRENDLLMQIRDITSAQVNVIMNITGNDASDDTLFNHITKLKDCNSIVGGTLYLGNGEMAGTFGASPELSMSRIQTSGHLNLRDNSGDYYDSAWNESELGRDYVLVLRQDASSVNRDLLAYTLRIASLVLIISIFVTAGAWIALDPIVVTPILRLRKDLTEAGDAISNDRDTPEFYAASVDRRDELGDVITAFNQMYNQIDTAVSERKNAEAALQKSFKQVETYSKALNMELERGREMQMNFLPATLPHRNGWEFAAFFKPARQVSGDFYDTFELPGNTVGVVIADVCDKGVGAALFMALFRSLIRIFSGQTHIDGLTCSNNGVAHTDSNQTTPAQQSYSEEFNPLKAIKYTNDYIIQNHEDLAMFATLFFGILNPATGSLTYVNGGHGPLYILNDDKGIRDRLGPTGPAVGVQPDANLEIRTTKLNPGDILFGYTDGVTEARSQDDTFFGEERLLSILKSGDDSAQGLLNRISSDLKHHIDSAEQFDDITMLTIKRLPNQAKA
jgi:serine phosphatase RsbU (regulator of sigma subunit)